LERKLASVYKSVERALEVFEERLRAELDGRVRDPGFFTGGKHLRPLSVFLAGKVFSEPSERALSAALAVELVHTGSLIHDDIVDGSWRRRGKDTLHKRAGVSYAVLVGDDFFLKAVEILAELCDKPMLQAFLRACREALEGEMLEEELGQEELLNRDIYVKVISKKTASLFSVAFELGALSRDAQEPELSILAKAGRNFGMAYQIVDDCEDLFAGKDSDLLLGKFTLPVIEAAERSLLLKEKLLKGDFTAEEVRGEVVDMGGLLEAVNTACRHLDCARKLVGSLSDPELEPLFDLFDYLEERALKATAP